LLEPVHDWTALARAVTIVAVRIFVYEIMIGGGLLAGRRQLPATLSAEGGAMLRAVLEDFAGLDALDVVTMLDDGLDFEVPNRVEVVPVAAGQAHDESFARLASQCDWTLAIAPETSGALSACCRSVLAAGGRLLGPSPELVDLAGDKQRTAEHLAAAGVPTPRGILWPNGNDRHSASISFPAVLKPRIGAGSERTRLLASSTELERLDFTASDMRLEAFCPGLPASVAALCGPAMRQPLLPCRQELTHDGRFQYLGGSLPLEPALARRAIQLAERAIDSLPDPLGYLGIDLILGHASDGRDDMVIEINPRLTTSYVGLRAAARDNLAGAMLAIAAGGSTQVSFHDCVIRFDAFGNVAKTNATSAAARGVP
jgi:predicted ATP-grasp superfamily ATP-dependent carboligase